jgi:hypothetical protein
VPNHTPPPAVKQLSRLDPTAEALGITPRTLRAWTYRRLVPCYRPTKRLLLFDIGEVIGALAKFKTG